MAQPYDITFKELFGRDAQPLLALLLPDGAGPLEVVELNPELPATLRRVDLLLRGVCRVRDDGPICDRILALDWQVQADPKLPAAMLLRAVLAYLKYEVKVTTLLIAATRAAAAVPTRLEWAEHGRGAVEHDVIQIRLYEQDAEPALASKQPELWVLATAMAARDGDRAELLARARNKIERAPEISAEQRERLLDYATMFATLEMKQADAEALLKAAAQRSHLMLDLKQSGYAQMLLAEGEARGEAKALLTFLEARRVTLSEAVRAKILACTDQNLLNHWLILVAEGREAEVRKQAEALKMKAA